MAEFPPNIVALVASGTSILKDKGLSLEFCTEIEVDSVKGLSPQQKNALKMAVRKRAQSQQGKKRSSGFIHRSSPCFSIFLSIFILYVHMYGNLCRFFLWVSSGVGLVKSKPSSPKQESGSTHWKR